MKLLAKQKAVTLRKRGYSIKEIAHEVSVSNSTASLWVRDVVLNSRAKNRLQLRVRQGVIVSARQQLSKTASEREHFFNAGRAIVKPSRQVSPKEAKLYVALIYWCEGTKVADNQVKFANSDPSLIKFFLTMLRKGFKLQSDKFRIMIHLHGYHSVSRQIEFWSKITKVPASQFYRPYQKPHTGTRQKPNYQGCITINYYDKLVAREIFGLLSAFSKLYS